MKHLLLMVLLSVQFGCRESSDKVSSDSTASEVNALSIPTIIEEHPRPEPQFEKQVKPMLPDSQMNDLLYRGPHPEDVIY